MSRALVVDVTIPQTRRAVREGEGVFRPRRRSKIETAADGAEALRRAGEDEFSLVITDLSMPNLDGLELVRARSGAGSAVPILVLTVRSEEREKVRPPRRRRRRLRGQALPASPSSSRAPGRRCAATRRRDRREHGSASATSSVDLDRQRVTRGGAEGPPLPTEFALLRTFVGKPGAVWTHRQLIGAVWGRGAGVGNDTVRVHVGSLRRKLERDPNRPAFLHHRAVGRLSDSPAPTEGRRPRAPPAARTERGGPGRRSARWPPATTRTAPRRLPQIDGNTAAGCASAGTRGGTGRRGTRRPPSDERKPTDEQARGEGLPVSGVAAQDRAGVLAPAPRMMREGGEGEEREPRRSARATALEAFPWRS